MVLVAVQIAWILHTSFYLWQIKIKFSIEDNNLIREWPEIFFFYTHEMLHVSFNTFGFIT